MVGSNELEIFPPTACLPLREVGGLSLLSASAETR